MVEIRLDDLSGKATRDLLALHFADMHEMSPPGTCFVLDLSGLQRPGITLWAAWEGETLLGVAALKTLPDGTGEVKSMRTHPDHLRKGVATALLDHLIAKARARRMARLSLETGRGSAFAPALALYRAHGFVEGGAFSDYVFNGFSIYMHLELAPT
jgi:putative acetyltransferase